MSETEKKEAIPILPEEVPVTMPDLPTRRVINHLDQFKAISDSTRTRILNIVQLTPATAKQIAGRLGASPGAIGHHLRVLEEAGFIQVSARRLVRGIVANYYTRTARLFEYQLPAELSWGESGSDAIKIDIVAAAHEEMIEAGHEDPEGGMKSQAFPHARLSPERAQHYQERLQSLLEDLLAEPADALGEVYGVLLAMFKSPAYLQSGDSPNFQKGQL